MTEEHVLTMLRGDAGWDKSGLLGCGMCGLSPPTPSLAYHDPIDPCFSSYPSHHLTPTDRPFCLL